VPSQSLLSYQIEAARFRASTIASSRSTSRGPKAWSRRAWPGWSATTPPRQLQPGQAQPGTSPREALPTSWQAMLVEDSSPGDVAHGRGAGPHDPACRRARASRRAARRRSCSSTRSRSPGATRHTFAARRYSCRSLTFKCRDCRRLISHFSRSQARDPRHAGAFGRQRQGDGSRAAPLGSAQPPGLGTGGTPRRDQSKRPASRRTARRARSQPSRARSCCVHLRGVMAGRG
jgi:hypothetical protein